MTFTLVFFLWIIRVICTSHVIFIVSLVSISPFIYLVTTIVTYIWQTHKYNTYIICKYVKFVCACELPHACCAFRGQKLMSCVNHHCSPSYCFRQALSLNSKVLFQLNPLNRNPEIMIYMSVGVCVCVFCMYACSYLCEQVCVWVSGHLCEHVCRGSKLMQAKSFNESRAYESQRV